MTDFKSLNVLNSVHSICASQATGTGLYFDIGDTPLMTYENTEDIDSHWLLPPIVNVEEVSPIPWTHGGFNDIYKGTYEGKPVAIKHVRFSTPSSPEIRYRPEELWNQEVQVWKSLTHANVLPFIGMTRVTGSPTPELVSPWLENGNIMQYLTNNPNVDRLQLVKSLASGMIYLHGQGVIHGDLHAGNILVDDEGSPRIADFGLSQIIQGTDVDMVNLSHARYQAPELVLGEILSPDVACDTYAFASLAYEILSGTRPHDNIATSIEVILAVYEKKPPYFNLSKRLFEPPNVDKAIWDLMQSCWSHVPGQRPQMRQIYDELESLHAVAANCPMQSHL